MKNTILITGASSGIGAATAQLFLNKGWNVIATMRKPEETTFVNSDQLLVTRLDVLDLESIQNAIDQGINKFGKLDVLLNNAGYGAYGVLESFSREQIIRQFNTNVIGLIDVTKAVLPHFRKNKSGIIINISSIGGKMTFPLGTLYHGTKFAVEGISEALSFEVEQFGAQVKIVEPGAIATDFGGRSLDFSNDESMVEYQHITQQVLIGMPQFFKDASPASVVAEVIFEAATDGKQQLRYTAGDDAKAIIAQHAQQDDATFMGGMKTLFGI
ncbi:SDR family oxidoreductase [Pedobacter duraquae]|uniref:Short-subunit dehydrogenase n=1 Tax=Pedobacter duraquae TaxID=425511 RepID=A0A4R6IHF0_9SPHI|nr:SDR family oxidoreductase [Pedobacter duraquae]TDO21287.1 short-subunit dehydrogenase [Pedobacter duraquae]